MPNVARMLIPPTGHPADASVPLGSAHRSRNHPSIHRHKVPTPNHLGIQPTRRPALLDPSSPSSPFQGGRQSEAMQGDSSTPGPRSHRTVPTRDRGTAERSDAGGFPSTPTSQQTDEATRERGTAERSEEEALTEAPRFGRFPLRVRGLACPPGSLRSPVPPKGRTMTHRYSSPSSPSSPFQGGRQRSEATMQGDSPAPPPHNRRTKRREKGGRQRSAATMQGDSGGHLHAAPPSCGPGRT